MVNNSTEEREIAPRDLTTQWGKIVRAEYSDCLRLWCSMRAIQYEPRSQVGCWDNKKLNNRQPFWPQLANGLIDREHNPVATMRFLFAAALSRGWSEYPRPAAIAGTKVPGHVPRQHYDKLVRVVARSAEVAYRQIEVNPGIKFSSAQKAEMMAELTKDRIENAVCRLVLCRDGRRNDMRIVKDYLVAPPAYMEVFGNRVPRWLVVWGELVA
jgi:hypothetical protein